VTTEHGHGPETLADVATPALVVDRARLQNNIDTMARRAFQFGVSAPARQDP